MINKKYTTSIEVSASPDYVFNHIIQLSEWWIEEFSGEELKYGSEFILKKGDEHFSKNKVIEFIPNTKFAWVTTESRRNTDNFDWTGTKMIFKLSPKDDRTLITFIYDGVVYEHEQNRLKEVCDFCIRNLLYNYLESFRTTIKIAKSPREVFKILTSDVSKWWGGKDLSGNSAKLHDEFVVHHKGAHYSKQKLTEVIPDKKIVWHVTESTLYWLKNDKQEWTNTKMIFEISTDNGNTILQFTHYGLVPSKECYAACKQGWTMVITDWLATYILEGKVNKQLL